MRDIQKVKFELWEMKGTHIASRKNLWFSELVSIVTIELQSLGFQLPEIVIFQMEDSHNGK